MPSIGPTPLDSAPIPPISKDDVPVNGRADCEAAMRVRLLSSILLILATASPTGTAFAQNFFRGIPCGNTVPGKLAEVGVTRDGIASVLTEAEWDRSEVGDEFVGWLVWISPKQCDGRLVARLSPRCVLETTYTTGACRIPGIQHSN